MLNNMVSVTGVARNSKSCRPVGWRGPGILRPKTIWKRCTI